mgnify:CR=1 FL=1
MITRESAETLGLAIGMEINALVKSSSVLLLKDKNIEIARRTVAKYREMLGILPSNQRKKVF